MKRPIRRLNLGTVAICDRGPDNDVGRARVSVKQGRQRRDEHHEDRGVFSLAEQPQLRHERRLERDAGLGASKRATGPPRLVERERGNFRRFGQSLAPERKLPLDESLVQASCAARLRNRRIARKAPSSG